jgi:hypothetical protein
VSEVSSDRPTIVVSAYNVARTPRIGGHFWVYLQYAHGLRQLGCDVYWLEQVPRATDASVLAVFLERMACYGFADRTILYAPRDGGTAFDFIGTTCTEANAVFRRTDLLVNFHYSICPSMLCQFSRTVLVDIDPGLLQFWMSRGQLAVPTHDFYVTTGETVGSPGTLIPDCGVSWVHIRPVVCLDLWPYAYDSTSRRFTTVSSWLGGEYVTENKRVLYENDKRISFLQFADLPTLTGSELELALYLDGRLDADDRELLERNGWHVRHSLEVADTPERYRAYIQSSRGEFSCAKPSCIEFQSAWVSDRTLCYLASGKPAVVQDTGPSAFLPSGEGLFRFATAEEAVDSLARIEADYERHCMTAREIAEAFFDARAVLQPVLTLV